MHERFVQESISRSGSIDIFNADQPWISEFASRGWIECLDDMISEEDRADFLDSAMEASSYQGRLYAIPYFIHTPIVFYRTDLFEEAGVKVPRTLEDFIETAPVIYEKTGVYAFSGVPTTYELVSFLGSQNGGTFITDNRNGHDGVSTKVLFDENGTFRTFLDKWKALYDTGAVNNLTSGVSSAFYAGGCASMLASSSNLSTALENTEGLFTLGVAYVPMVDEKATGGVNIGGGCLAAFNNSAEVKEVMEFMISSSSQAYWAENTGYMPVNANTIESDAWQAFTAENPLYSVALEQALSSNESVIGLWIPSAYQVYYSFQSTIASVLTGEMSIDDAVSFMADMINTNLKEYARQNG